VKALRSDGQVVHIGQLEGAFGLGPVGEEAAGLPAQRSPP
jgi:hypothetical protein